jgi:hypothetical protein
MQSLIEKNFFNAHSKHGKENMSYPPSMTTSPTKLCPVCTGDGIIEWDVAVPMSFSNPSGYLVTKEEPCYECDGSGEVVDHDGTELDWIDY